MTLAEKDRPLVAAITDTGEGKIALLEKVLHEGRFFEVLEKAREKSGKAPEEFQVAVKPNLSMMLRRSDVGTYTDPSLVIHFLRLMAQRGYTDLVVVESQNLYGNWFENRSVVEVAARAGYFETPDMEGLAGLTRHPIRVRGGGVDLEVPLVDLTPEPETTVKTAGNEEIGVGRAWAEADFRVSFAKLKSHFYSYYTLSIKNVYGCLPAQDKVRAYHCKRLVAPWTARAMAALPVDYCLVDGYTAADGWLGVKIKAIPARPHTLIAGNDPLAVDHRGAGLMGIPAEKSIIYRELARISPRRPYKSVGNARPFPVWKNTLYLLVWFCQIIESSAWFMDYSGSLATGGYDPCFPHKNVNRGIFKRILFFLTLPVNILMDLGFLKLRMREKYFLWKIHKNRAAAPTLAAEPLLTGRLRFLSPDDAAFLARVLAQKENAPPTLSGHLLFCGDREWALPAELYTANLAIRDFLELVDQKGLDPQTLSTEIRNLLDRNTVFGARKHACCFA